MLQTWKSAHPQTEFAPSWNIPFWNATYPNPADIDFAREWIINNEKKIVDQFNETFHRTHGDGGTGLGSDSLTSKYPYFNLFKLTRDLPAFKNIFSFIKGQYIKFIDEQSNGKTRNCVFVSWANVVRTGQEFDVHDHGSGEYAYLSGNMHLDNYKTSTLYYCPFNEKNVKSFDNVKGGLTIFPSYVKHGVKKHSENKERVSLAFDLYVEGDKFTNGNEIEFIKV
jgi:hypothetical protein